MTIGTLFHIPAVQNNTIIIWTFTIILGRSFENLVNGYLNKLKNILKNKKKRLSICSFTYRLLVIQISCNSINI
jgi:hypothetical protein